MGTCQPTGRGTGGPPTVADFDGDGLPEIAAAGASAYTVFDLDCTGEPLPEGCASEGVLWSQASQDQSSNKTGSSVYDFEGDGQAEAVYGDECFLRVYNGASGEVLYSALAPVARGMKCRLLQTWMETIARKSSLAPT